MPNGRLDEVVINTKVYEDENMYLGMADLTLPDLTALIQEISGLGIAGKVEAPVVGHYEAMTLTINFRTTTEQSVRLSEPRVHNLTVMSAIQEEDPATGEITIRSVKHYFRVNPKSDKGGTLTPASTQGGSGEYAVRYWSTFNDGKKIREIDPWNMIANINGTDYLADTRRALGM